MRWSPTCAAWASGAPSARPSSGRTAPTGPAEGARFVGHNRGGPRGLMRWSRRGRILTADVGREFAFVTEEGGHESTVWRYRFEPRRRRHAGHRVLRGQADSRLGSDTRRPDQSAPRTSRRHAPHAPATEDRRRGHQPCQRPAVTLNVAPGGYLLDAGSGEALWFSGGLLTYKTTGDQTFGNLAVAEVRAPKGSGSPSHRHHHEDEAWYILDGDLTFWLGDEQRSRVRRRLRVRSPHGRAPLPRRLGGGPLPPVAHPGRIRGFHPNVWIAGEPR